MHILCWDSAVLGKKGIQLEEQLLLSSGMELTVTKLWAGIKYLRGMGCICGAEASKGDCFFADTGFSAAYICYK